MERAKVAEESDRNGGNAVGQKAPGVVMKSARLLMCVLPPSVTLGSSQRTSFYSVRSKTVLVINTTRCLLCLYRCT